MFRSSSLDKTLDVACSHLRLEPDWPSILLICDLIRQNDTTPKYAIQSIKKKLLSQNPHTAYYALLVLESVVKNCGAPIHDEISTRENCEIFTQLIESTPHENVKSKMLELIQAWAYAFRTVDKYQAVKDTMTILKTKGHTFPELKEADAMFTSDTAPIWHDGKVCHRCRVEFTFTQRKHHCRNCGQVFCAQCSAKNCTLPKFGIEKEVRVCDGCYAMLQKPSSGTLKRGEGPNDLPAEYLNSSLSQQSQTPVRKTDQELKEEEELQLALALSQSEAEIKNKKTTSYRMSTRKTSSPEVVNNVSPIAPYLERDSSPISATTFDDRTTDPELAKYLNRDYWEQRGSASNGHQQSNDIPANPTAPTPTATPQPNTFNLSLNLNNANEDAEIENFASNLRTQVEIFVNRMKSNSSRGRSISTDSSVQNLFLNLTAFHSRLLDYIKKADDKRMWFEQLQDKLTQIKDSRAALDVLRQEHQEKLRQQAEEQERQRQMQMAYKLELMRKKKQEYLQYQRQLALQRIQEQEREMKMHQDQQKVMYSMGVQLPYSSPYTQHPPGTLQQVRGLPNESSPAHMITPNINNYAPGPTGSIPLPAYLPHSTPQMERYSIPTQPTMYSAVGGQPAPIPGMHTVPYPNQIGIPNSIPNMAPPPSQPQANIGIPNQAFPSSQMPPVHTQPQGISEQPIQYAPQQQPEPQQPITTPNVPAPVTIAEEKEPVQENKLVPEAELISFD
ncbi:hepatocyte growth factor-regulated tyrosine kinase substrate [Contarinia nasturtii]|uniref:hepatocyte growth factor-regulated tyrosine kinase substrate n=1 Tax=Contarinia nasturtii TaxID=265458 RepID=UPI0012D3D61A|nr:hepatocyte growth factor-regulated tyrosine kinase substrate [Contarinia nasturtii]